MNVLVTGRLPEEALRRVMAEHEVVANATDSPILRSQLLDQVTDKEGLLCMITDTVDEELMDAAPRLRMIANYGVGFNNIDVPAATARKIPVSNTPGVLTDATAELTIALLLSVARRVVEGDHIARSGRFRHWAPLLFLGTEVSGKTLGIVGMGDIGKAVARRAAAFNLKILYHQRRRLDQRQEEELGATFVQLNTLLAESDFVSLHVPLTGETYHLIGRNQFSRMKPTAFLINVARGPVVDEQALVHALQEKLIAGAGLDVYEHEPELADGLAALHNTVLLPHVGSATRETRSRMAELAVNNLLAGLRGETPPNCVNA
jgi:glyoxylate reductase